MMADWVQVTCPSCGRALRVPESYVGRRVCCKYCDAELQLEGSFGPGGREVSASVVRDPGRRSLRLVTETTGPTPELAVLLQERDSAVQERDALRAQLDDLRARAQETDRQPPRREREDRHRPFDIELSRVRLEPAADRKEERERPPREHDGALEALRAEHAAILDRVRREGHPRIEPASLEATEPTSSLDVLRRRLAAVEGEREELVATVRRLRECLDGLTREVEQARGRREEQEERLAGLARQLEEARQAREAAEEALRDEVERLAASWEESEARAADAGRRGLSLDAALADIVGELRATRAESDELRAKLREADEELSRLRLEGPGAAMGLADARAELSRIRAELDRQRGANRRALGELADREEDLEAHRTKLVELRSLLATREYDLGQSRLELKAARKLAEDSRSRVEALESSGPDEREARARLEAERGGLEEKLSEALRNGERWRGDHDLVQGELARLREELVTKVAELSALGAELGTSRVMRQSALEEARAERERAGALVRERDEARGRLDWHREEEARARREAEEREDELDSLEIELAEERDARREAERSRLEETARLEEEVAGAMRKIEDIQRRRVEHEEERTRNRSQLAAAREENERLAGELTSARSWKHRQELEASNELLAARDRARRAEGQLAESQRREEHSRSELETALARLEEYDTAATRRPHSPIRGLLRRIGLGR